MKKMRKNNKGFTLVELIIVIAVIAILSAVAAPQYIKYVERSRESNDATMAASIREAALVAALDPVNGDDTFTVTWDTSSAANTAGTNAISVDGDNGTKIKDAITEIVTAAPVPESKFALNQDFKVTITAGVVDTSGTNANPWASIMK